MLVSVRCMPLSHFFRSFAGSPVRTFLTLPMSPNNWLSPGAGWCLLSPSVSSVLCSVLLSTWYGGRGPSRRKCGAAKTAIREAVDLVCIGELWTLRGGKK